MSHYSVRQRELAVSLLRTEQAHEGSANEEFEFEPVGRIPWRCKISFEWINPF
jgi:hypothetical protein